MYYIELCTALQKSLALALLVSIYPKKKVSIVHFHVALLLENLFVTFYNYGHEIILRNTKKRIKKLTGIR